MDKTILLIEDNLEVRENTAELLELANYTVITAENGKVGVQHAREHNPDLIICDIMMPELDGYGVLHILSKNSKTAQIPFIFLTAKAEKSDFRKGMNLGADDYLTKPFDETELMDAIESRLKKSEAIKSTGEGQEGLEDLVSKARGLEELKSLSEDRKTKRFPKREIIFREGDYPNAVFLINSGKIKTFKINEDGKEYVTGLHTAGDYLGYMPVLENVDQVESAAVLEEAEVITIPRQDFLSLIHGNREVSSQFIKLLSRDLIEKEQQLLDLAYNTVRKRVADALIQLYDKYPPKDNEPFKMAISRNDLASIVGTATESVIRILSEFKSDSWIKIEGSEIMILDYEAIKGVKY